MPKNVMRYKGHCAEISFDSEVDVFHGRVIAATGVIDFYGRPVAELRRELKNSVEGHIARREEEGMPPAKTLKELILAMPDVGDDADFERPREP